MFNTYISIGYLFFIYPLTIAYILDILSFASLLEPKRSKLAGSFPISQFTPSPAPGFTPESPPPPSGPPLLTPF
jgi:hypothetical protein